ncbi:hypothetical protein Q1695_014438 [Nippostrongylus brasiliensis]|nr:hypothetical protein Q1695_014438 [Nippostrongylus brasiliensis]
MARVRDPKKPRTIDDIFILNGYQALVVLFNELFIFTMLSNVVFNIFGTAHTEVLGCDDSLFNGTQTEACQFLQSSDCKQPVLSYEFLSAKVEFGEYCSQNGGSWLDEWLTTIGVASKSRFSTTLQMVGVIVGSAIAGQLSDLYGRKKITLLLLIGTLFFSTASSFVSSMNAYVYLRFFIGIFCGGLATVGTIFVVENLPAKHRFWMCTVVTWAPNYILFALFAYLTGHWRILARACNVVTAAAVLLLTFALPESPKFLVQKHRREDAIRALLYVNRFRSEALKLSKSEIQRVVDRSITATGAAERRKKKYTFVHLYSTASLSIRTLVLSFGMFSVSYITYGLIFNLHVIQGSLYLNTALSGVLRWTVGALVAIVDHVGGKSVGRKRLHVVSVAVVAICLASIFLIEVTGNTTEMVVLVRTLTLLAFGTTGCIFLQFLLVTAELFPTAIRNLANSHVNVCGRLGNVFGPLAFSLPSSINGLPYLVMAILGFIDIILFQVSLPESKGKPLPNEMPKKKEKKNNADSSKLISES